MLHFRKSAESDEDDEGQASTCCCHVTCCAKQHVTCFAWCDSSSGTETSATLVALGLWMLGKTTSRLSKGNMLQTNVQSHTHSTAQHYRFVSLLSITTSSGCSALRHPWLLRILTPANDQGECFKPKCSLTSTQRLRSTTSSECSEYNAGECTREMLQTKVQSHLHSAAPAAQHYNADEIPMGLLQVNVQSHIHSTARHYNAIWLLRITRPTNVNGECFN
jgi:hypothetical protein